MGSDKRHDIPSTDSDRSGFVGSEWLGPAVLGSFGVLAIRVPSFDLGWITTAQAGVLIVVVCALALVAIVRRELGPKQVLIPGRIASHVIVGLKSLNAQRGRGTRLNRSLRNAITTRPHLRRPQVAGAKV